jgi:hypothetical protein
MPQVTVTMYVKTALNEIQEREQHTSIDSVIRSLLIKGGYWQSVKRMKRSIAITIVLSHGLITGDRTLLLWALK